MKKLNGNKLRKQLDKLIPDCALDQDNHGQVIIYTGLQKTKNGNYKKLKSNYKSLK
jgi:hypothetical protein